MLRLSWLKFLDYFFTPKTPSFAALATRNLTTVLAGILIFCCVFGLKPVRAVSLYGPTLVCLEHAAKRHVAQIGEGVCVR